MKRVLLVVATLLTLCDIGGGAKAGDLVAAILPSSRSTTINRPTTVYATIINTSGHVATGCAITTTDASVTLSYQPTNPTSNRPQGTANTPVTIATGASQSFIVTLTSSVVQSAVDFPITFDCGNTEPAPIVAGLDTLLLNVSAVAKTDIVALAATVTNDGVLTMAQELDAKAAAIASINLGTAATITVKPDLGDFSTLPITLSICQTTISGACMAAPTPSVTVDFAAGATPTFGIFASVTGPVPFAPGSIRISVLFTDATGILRGRTSIALKTPEGHHPGSTPGGVYVGTWLVTSSPSKPQPVAAIVSEDGEFHLLPGRLASSGGSNNPIMRETLALTVADNLTFTATGHSYVAGNGTTAVSGNVAATGIYSPHKALVLDYQNGTETGVFHLNYVSRFYEQTTPLAQVAGLWFLHDEGGNGTGSITIAGDGSFTGQNAAGCGLSGAISLIDKRYSVLRVSLTAAACAGAPAANFAGLTTLQSSVPRQELVENASKELAVGNEQEVESEDADRGKMNTREMVTELSNATQSVASFITAK
jgi:hypothetical protein